MNGRRDASFLKKALGTLCRYCPVCRYGRKRPDSWVGRALRHPAHAEHCPAWKAEAELYPRKEQP